MKIHYKWMCAQKFYCKNIQKVLILPCYLFIITQYFARKFCNLTNFSAAFLPTMIFFFILSE